MVLSQSSQLPEPSSSRRAAKPAHPRLGTGSATTHHRSIDYRALRSMSPSSVHCFAMVLQKTVSRAVKCIHANGRGSELPKQKGSRSSGSGFHKAGRCISRGASNQTSTLIDNHLEELPLTTLLCSANRRISLPCAPKRTPRRFRRCATSRHGSSIALRIAVNAQT